ncbi:MAG: sensor domain-containing diguanylate cyclase [Sulfurimonas sp.]
MQEKLLSFICQKSQISYILFDEDFHITKTFLNESKIGSDIRETLWEIVGFEEDILREQKLEIPMILRENEYYDLFVEPFSNKEKKLFIAYMQQKSKDTHSYANVLKEINKKTLIFDTSDEKKESRYYQEINKRLLTLHVNSEGKITKVNDAVTYFFNTQNSALQGVHFSKLFTPQSSKKEAKSNIFVAKNSFGKEIFFHADIIPLKNRENKIVENIIIAQDVSYLKEIEKELQYAQEHDTLTGLPNRHYLLRAIEHREKPTIALLDIVSFHKVNEEYGAHAGDMLLKHTTSLLQSLLEPQDTLTRLFGDTFVILFESEKNRTYIDALVNKIKEAMHKNPLYYTQEDIITATLTIVVVETNDEPISAKELLKNGEKALQREKLLKKS